MTVDSLAELPDSSVPRRQWHWFGAALLLMIVVQLPTVPLAFVGDDYEWWLESVRRMAEPSRLMDPYGGLRLTNPLLMMPDHLLWGDWVPGWHLTNLLFHALMMLLLYRLALRLGLTPPVAGVLTAVWSISPFTAFQVREIHPRHDPLQLACWLGVGLLWPSPGERWTVRRAVAVVALALVSALTKESWVVLPGFVLAYELAFRRSDWWPAVRSALIWAVGPLVYVVAYLVRPAVDAGYAAGYYSGGAPAAAKVASTLATFCGLVGLDTSSVRYGPAEWLATAVIVVVAIVTLRTRYPLLLVGSALFLLPFVPVIPVGFMIGRYAYVPFAGFLLIGVGLAELAWRQTRTKTGRRLVVGVGCAAALALTVGGLRVMAGELRDADRRDDAHRRLVEEGRRFRQELPRDRTLVCVRLERVSLNAEVLGATEGLPKAYFERANYPYGLVRWAELFSWVGVREDGPLWEEVRPEVANKGRYSVIGHAEDRFVVLPAQAPDAPTAAADWAQRGFPVRVIRPLSASRE